MFRIFDAMNDVRNLRVAIEAVKAAGKHAQGTIAYTTSPVHTIEAFVNQAKQMEAMGCDSVAYGVSRPAMSLIAIESHPMASSCLAWATKASTVCTGLVV